MKIQITIPESAIKDVTEYCRIEGIDLHGRMQQTLNDFVCNAIGQMEQRRRVEDIDSRRCKCQLFRLDSCHSEEKF